MSTITRSAIAINPEGAEADALRGWWDATGCSAVLTHAGEGLASALKCAHRPSSLEPPPRSLRCCALACCRGLRRRAGCV